MTIAELMRELDAGHVAPGIEPHVFRLYCRGIERSELPRYNAEIYTSAHQDVDGFAIMVGKGSALSYEEAVGILIRNMLCEFGVACSVCGNKHLPAVMLETDEVEPKPLCEDCAQHANDMRPEETE